MARITGIRRQLSPRTRLRRADGAGARQSRARRQQPIASPSPAWSMAEDECWPDSLLALDSGALEGTVEGRAVRDPSFGLEAVWIDPAKRTEAVIAGYTVVDPPTVIATQLNQIIADAAADLFGMDEAQKLLDALKESAPQLVAGLTPGAAVAGAHRRRCAARCWPSACRSRISAASPRRWSRPRARAPIRPSWSRRCALRIGAIIVQSAGAGADAAAGHHARRRAGGDAGAGGARRAAGDASVRAGAGQPHRRRGHRRGRAAGGAGAGASRSSPRRSRAARSPGCSGRICPTRRCCPSSRFPTASRSRSSPSSAGPAPAQVTQRAEMAS